MGGLNGYKNEVAITMPAVSENEAFARIAASAFITPLNPSMGELNDIKTAVSEAVTNAVIHAYKERDGGEIILKMKTENRAVYIEVTDFGVGIEDIARAREPLYTGSPEDERSGLGFTVMETFMDSLRVESRQGRGTTVSMSKTLAEAAV
ncbi:MAG: anti-sigma F factor [Clostridiales bacterium]|jgi:stage II sporulation protein AB (anti-sigma F factor)|nr:anti-sigma F factor [Clostridiales bacterium]